MSAWASFSANNLITYTSGDDTTPVSNPNGPLKGRKSYKLLAQHMHMSISEVKTWMKSKHFKPYFDKLYLNYIKSSQDQAAMTRTPRKQCPSLQIVEAAVVEDKNGQQLYLDLWGEVDTSNYKAIEWLAQFLVRCEFENTQKRKGIFVNKDMTGKERRETLVCAANCCRRALAKQDEKLS